MSDLQLTITILGGLASVTAIVIALWINRRPRPLYALRLAKMGGINHPNISFNFGDQTVDNLFSARLVLLNKGRKEIRREDLPSTEARPRLTIDGEYEILSYDSNTTTGDESGDFIVNNNGEYALDFDYLNPGDAFMGEIYFTSDEGIKPDIKFNGHLKGMEVMNGNVNKRFSKDKFIYTGMFTIIIISLVYMIFEWSKEVLSSTSDYSMLTLLATYMVMAIYMIYKIISLRSDLPEECSDFLLRGEY